MCYYADMRPTLYIMCGLPYSGKTTFAQTFSEQSGFPLVSIDDIRESLGFFWGKHEATSADWKKIFKEVEAELTTHLQADRSVIYDSANHDKASRETFRALAKNLHCDVKVVFLDTPLEVIESRRKANLMSNERAHIPDEFYTSALETFEPPTTEENVVRAEQLLRG